jgi:hypothetical protein
VVEVVDAGSRPIPGAEVTIRDGDPAAGIQGGTILRTSSRGQVCSADLLQGRFIDVVAPDHLGGPCAGRARFHLDRWDPDTGRPPFHRVTLPILRVPRSAWKGRVVDPRGRPLAGASIHLARLEIEVGDRTCDLPLDHPRLTSAADGAFALPPVAQGKVTIEVRHRDHAPGTFIVDVPGAPRDLALDWGAVWMGRILDPEGAVLALCDLFLQPQGNDLVYRHCSARGFEFRGLPPGVAQLEVRLNGHPRWGGRSLTVQANLGKDEQRRQDVRWPRGAPLAGRVTFEGSGAPVPGARLSALPRGIVLQYDRRHPEEVAVEADAHGRFALRHLRPGLWVLHGDRRSSRQRAWEVRTGQTSLRLTVPAP